MLLGGRHDLMDLASLGDGLLAAKGGLHLEAKMTNVHRHGLPGQRRTKRVDEDACLRGWLCHLAFRSYGEDADRLLTGLWSLSGNPEVTLR